MENFQKGSTVHLQLYLEDAEGNPIHGATCIANLYRNSDNAYYDYGDNTFGAGVFKDIPLFEFNDTGIYRYDFNQTHDEGGVQRDYTVQYKVSAPFVSASIDTLQFSDVDNIEVKGAGWDLAATKPSLMKIANKDGSSTFDATTDSLEILSTKVDGILSNTTYQVTGV